MNTFLQTISDKQLGRVFSQAWQRMQKGDGYQPFGYDWGTLLLTKPGWHKTLRLITGEMMRRNEIQQKRKVFDMHNRINQRGV